MEKLKSQQATPLQGSGTVIPASQPAANAWVRLQQNLGNQAVRRMFDPSMKIRRCTCGNPTSGGGTCASCQEDEQLRRSAKDRSVDNDSAPQIVQDSLRSPGHPLEENARSMMESRFGRDFRHVRVSADESSAAAADAIHAKAFTCGNRIVFGRNEYAPHSSPGLRLIAHELAHTAQQSSSAPSVQTSLRVGSIDDPQEREADRAADVAMNAGPVPALSTGSAAVRRQPKSSGYAWEPKGPNEGLYTGSDGQRYTVIRTAKPVTTSEKTGVAPGAKFAKAYITITWCKYGVRGTAEVGVDITNQLQQLIPQMLSTGNPQQVLENAKLTPYVDLVLLPNQKEPIKIVAKADIGREGVSSVQGGITVDTPIGKVDATAGVDLPQGGRPSPSVSVTVTPRGESKRQNVNCEMTKFEETYECRKEQTIPPHDESVQVTESVPPRTRYIYFDYAKDIITSTRTKYGKDHPDVVARNDSSFEQIRQDIADGYLVSTIEGFTSPEGPMDPKGKFEGNATLSQERADAALRVLSGGLCLLRRDACGTDRVKPVGKGELFTKSENGEELKGKQLAEFAVPGFMESEGSDLTDAERKSLEKKRGALGKSDIVYPLLRRAKIVLTHGPVSKEVTKHVPGSVTNVTVDCPEEVKQAAKLQFSLMGPAQNQNP